MSQEKRIHKAGIYHVFNRGVGQRQIFAKHEDRLFFIENFSKLSKGFDFFLHSYALVSNGYNMLIQTKRDNLSQIMKNINGRYAQYYNRQYDRKGHLWEGRFKSIPFEDHSFLLDIIAYIEYLPIQSGVASSRIFYDYSSYRQLIGLDETLPLLQNSYIFKMFNSHAQIKDFLDAPVDLERIRRVHILLKKLAIQKSGQTKEPKTKLPMIQTSYFRYETRSERNNIIQSLYKKGYTQASIAKAFMLSQQAISKIIREVFE